jgi:hypothetical protein
MLPVIETNFLQRIKESVGAKARPYAVNRYFTPSIAIRSDPTPSTDISRLQSQFAP